MDDALKPLIDLIPAKWHTTAAIVVLLIPYVTRAIHAVRTGNGIVGAWNSILYGTNMPKQQPTETKGNEMNVITKVGCLLMAAFMIGGSGCTTTSTGQKIVDPVVLQTIAQSAASTASYIYLQSNPQDKDKFVLAQKALQALIASGSGDVASLQNALASLPIKQLQGTQGAIIVANAVTIINLASKELVKLDKNQVASLYVLPVAQGLLDGLNQTLGN